MSGYAPAEINGQMCVWLQGHGWCPAKHAYEIKTGDTLAYNWHCYGTVTAVRHGKMVRMTVCENGKEYTVSKHPASWVAVAEAA